MTQPPQPPNEPPQGGFGAPQDPPPGGFGAPQDPPPGGFGAPQDPPPVGFGKAPEPQNPSYGYPQTPPPAQPPTQPAGQPAAGPPPQSPPPPPGQPQGQPTYGYPQAPGTPPPGQPQGYGYPGQPGQPYGQPTQPYGQQAPYGAYQQPGTMPMAPQAAPGGSGGSKLSGQMKIIIGAVVAIALIVGGGVFYASTQKDDTEASSAGPTGKGGEDKKGGGGDEQGPSGPGQEKVPASTSATVSMQLPQPEVPKDDVWSIKGSWLTEDVYAKAGVNEIVGYDPSDGKELWTLPLAGQTCAGSREVTKDGIVAVAYEEGKRTKKGDHETCSQISAVDLKDGKRLWTETIDEGSMKARVQEVTISGSTVAAGSSAGGAAFDLTSGKHLWEPTPGDKCQDEGYAGGEQLVAVQKCGTYGDEKLKVQLLDAKTGKSKWTYPVTPGVDNAKIISTRPVVFGQDTQEITASGVTDAFSLDDQGKLRAKISLPDGKYDHDCEVNVVYACTALAVGNDKLYVPTRQHEGGGDGYSQTNEIISFSLATGKTTGDRADAGEDGEMFPIRMDGGNILAYKDGGYNKGAQVVSLNGKTMKETKLLETPAAESVGSAISSMVPKSNELLYTDGRLYLGKELISKPYSKDEKEYTALGFVAQ
ncbi:PQQ-binding-like beta-propeller repeat protein [Streptomyces sp. SYP-A7185]|uniref:outer membrane protein assembly factor BamB family protein n=1 Tax=Streptomyces sp. SYP-A7185 TaxID=3040076 RepID=UPI0038F74587